MGKWHLAQSCQKEPYGLTNGNDTETHTTTCLYTVKAHLFSIYMALCTSNAVWSPLDESTVACFLVGGIPNQKVHNVDHHTNSKSKEAPRQGRPRSVGCIGGRSSETFGQGFLTTLQEQERWKTKSNDKACGSSVIGNGSQLTFQNSQDNGWNTCQQSKLDPYPSIVLHLMNLTAVSGSQHVITQGNGIQRKGRNNI